MGRNAFQHCLIASEIIIFRTVMKYNFMEKTDNIFREICVLENGKQNLFIDAHKKRADVKLKKIGRLLPVA